MSQFIKIFSLHATPDVLAEEIQETLNLGFKIVHMTSETGRLVVILESTTPDASLID